MAWKPEDIKELMLQDQAKGRRIRRDPSVAAERRKRERVIRKLLTISDEKTFWRELRNVIADYGLHMPLEEQVQIWQMWKILRYG